MSEPRVWKNGAFVEEQHLSASGLPVATIAVPALDEWRLLDGYYPAAGIEVRWHDGQKFYRATASIDDERYPGEKGPVYSQEFFACDEADAQPVDAYAHINPGAEQTKRAIAAAVARSHMRFDQAALSDMRARLRDLEADLLYPYKLWTMALERHVVRMSQTAALREQVATMLQDIQEHGMVPEYEQFIEQLKMLLKGTK